MQNLNKRKQSEVITRGGVFIIEITNKELREEQRHTKVVVPQELVDNWLRLYQYLPTARHRRVEGKVDNIEAISGG